MQLLVKGVWWQGGGVWSAEQPLDSEVLECSLRRVGFIKGRGGGSQDFNQGVIQSDFHLGQRLW